MSNSSKIYNLHSGNNKIPVGPIKPYYDRSRRGWVTGVGIFTTPNQSDYSVTAEIHVSVATAAPTPETVPELSPTPTPN
jgi:hypothetical protein